MLGTLLAGCDQDEYTDSLDVEVQQEQYASLDECRRDWDGDDFCDPTPITQSNGLLVYMGPRYYYNHSMGMPMVISRAGVVSSLSSRGQGISVGKATSTVSISRGGFGATAHAVSAGHGSAGG